MKSSLIVLCLIFLLAMSATANTEDEGSDVALAATSLDQEPATHEEGKKKEGKKGSRRGKGDRKGKRGKGGKTKKNGKKPKKDEKGKKVKTGKKENKVREDKEVAAPPHVHADGPVEHTYGDIEE